MKAGKDVYCEKPLTLTIDEGKALVRVAAETNKSLPDRQPAAHDSTAAFAWPCELVRNGRVGQVQTIECRDRRQPGRRPVQGIGSRRKVSTGISGWGRRRSVDYVKEKCHYDFRWWYEYSGGKMTDWGAHHHDIAQWALGMDSSGPIAVEATGEARPSAATATTATRISPPPTATPTAPRCEATSQGRKRRAFRRRGRQMDLRQPRRHQRPATPASSTSRCPRDAMRLPQFQQPHAQLHRLRQAAGSSRLPTSRSAIAR